MTTKRASSAIAWDLLTPAEAEFFRDIGASLSAVDFKFTKPVTWPQFTTAFSHIIGLKHRTPKRGTLINFAIGGCLNAGEQLFGKKRVTAWLREFRLILGMRDTSLQLAGGLLILLQQLEEHIRLCCATLPSAALSVEDFFSDDSTKRRQTLGSLSRELKGAQVFSQDFEERLDKLVFMRNQFIHHLWVNQFRKNVSPSPFPSREEYELVVSALRALAVEASYLMQCSRASVTNWLSASQAHRRIPRKIRHQRLGGRSTLNYFMTPSERVLPVDVVMGPGRPPNNRLERTRVASLLSEFRVPLPVVYARRSA